MPTPKTITIYLADGDPSGIKIATLSNCLVKILLIPRDRLKNAKNRDELGQPALYMLFGSDDDNNNFAYIGEAENAYSRLVQHTSNKDFWDTAIVVVSQSNTLTKADIKYLESLVITKAKELKRYELKNGNSPVLNTLPEHLKASNQEFLSDTKILLSSLGYPIIKELPSTEQETIYYLNTKGAEGKGIYAENSFTLLPGSKARIETTGSFGGKAEEDRKKFLKTGLFKQEGEYYVLQEKHICNSPVQQKLQLEDQLIDEQNEKTKTEIP